MLVKFHSVGMKQFPDGYRVFCHNTDEAREIPAEYIDALHIVGAEVIQKSVEKPAEPVEAPEEISISEVFDKLVEGNNPEDFTADGSPKVNAVRRVLGEDSSIDKQTVVAAWEQYSIIPEGESE